jgi:hypothetical protein
VSVSPGNNLLITAGQNTPTVVTSVLAPIVSGGVNVKPGPGIVPTTGVNTAFPSSFGIQVTENYIDMFRDQTQFNSGAASNSVQLLYTFSGIPTGSSFSCAAASALPGAVADGTMTVNGSATTSVTATANTVTASYTSGSGPSLSGIDTITLTCGPFVNGTATLPLAAGSITATVSLAPVGNAFSATNGVLNNPASGGQIPRYTGPSFGPLTVINIIPLTTHMIWPFVSVGNGFDTGMVVANTTGDPYGGTKFGGAAPLNGAVTIEFFPSGSGTPFCVSTASSAPAVAGLTCTTVTAGAGLSSGVVNSGSSWTVLLSAILAQVTGAPSAFSGYAFGIANFPFGHPTGFVADAAFSGKFAAGGPMLVIPNPAVSGRTTFPGIGLAESLGH